MVSIRSNPNASPQGQNAMNCLHLLQTVKNLYLGCMNSDRDALWLIRKSSSRSLIPPDGFSFNGRRAELYGRAEITHFGTLGEMANGRAGA